MCSVWSMNCIIRTVLHHYIHGTRLRYTVQYKIMSIQSNRYTVQILSRVHTYTPYTYTPYTYTP